MVSLMLDAGVVDMNDKNMNDKRKKGKQNYNLLVL